MELVLRLAQNLYQNFFGNNVVIYSAKSADFFRIVKENTTLLNTPLERKIFYDELVNLLREDKIAMIEDQRQKYKVPILQNYKEIEIIYHQLKWIIEGDSKHEEITSLNIEPIVKDNIVGNNETNFTSFKFNGLVNTSKLNNCLCSIDLLVDLVCKEKCQIEDLFVVLTTKDLNKFKGQIYLNCETSQFSFIVDKLANYFHGSLKKSIELSKVFYTKRNKLLTANNLHQAKRKSPTPKLANEITAIFKAQLL